ncbi:unnamed protein product [Urochloa humidicola]
MASDSSEDRWRRSAAIPRHADLHGADEPEEGEVVPGYHSDTDTEEYYNCHSDSDQTVSDSHAAVNDSYYGDDATSRYSVAASHGAGAAVASYVAAASRSNGGGCKASSSKAAAMLMLACPICGKEFRSQKAVCGHMKVHQRVAVGSSVSQQEQGIGKGKGIKRDVAAVVGTWGGTGKRGCSGLGGRAAAESDQSMAIVVAEPQIVFQPMPLAFATPNLSSSSVTIASASPIQSPLPVASAMAAPNPSSVTMASASPNLSSLPVASAIMMTNVSDQSSSAEPIHNDANDTVVAQAAANNPLSEAVVHQHAAPPAAGEQVPSVHQQPMAPPAAPMELAPPVDHQLPPIAPPRPRQNPKGYTCDECSVWFPTHQGLVGHVAGHRNREAAAGGVPGDGGGGASCRRGARPEKEHVCKICGAVFPAGVQLGGHMRKHYAGPPIVPNKRPRLVSGIQTLMPPPVGLTLSLSLATDEASPSTAAAAQPAEPEPAVEGTHEPVPAPAVPGRVLLFGIDIGVAVQKQQKPAAQEGPSATERSESTGGEQ